VVGLGDPRVLSCGVLLGVRLSISPFDRRQVRRLKPSAHDAATAIQYPGRMTFTALHRAAGAEPGELTDAILDAAIESGAIEASDLDWKRRLPDEKELKTFEFPKDVAAMANSGGGVIVYGVDEVDKAATGRVDENKCDESYERTLRAVACSAIMPPVFNLGVRILGNEGRRAVVVEVPASVEVPHLVRHCDSPHFYGAPRRNDADTIWMTERELESMYRLRFEERRHSTETLDALHADASAGRDTTERVWLISVAHPRLPQLRERLTEKDAQNVISGAMNAGGVFTEVRRRGPTGVWTRTGVPRGQHPLEAVGIQGLRPGLRRWITPPKYEGSREAWASVHHDGSVTLAAVVGGHRTQRDPNADSWGVASWAIEAAVADFMALVWATATQTSNDEYDVRVACEWDGTETMAFRQNDAEGYAWDNGGVPVHHFTPVETSLRAQASLDDFNDRVFELARDCLNQGGVSDLHLIDAPQRSSS
jgi:hypothetical protein